MNFSNLKPGDKVVIDQPGGFTLRRPYIIATVLEVGAKKIKTDKGDFSTTSGNKWGGTPYHCDRLDDVSIEKALQANVEIEQEYKQAALVRKLNDFNWRRLDYDTLKKVAEIVGVES